MVEQPPDPNSRITLSRSTDRFAVPLSRIDWRIGDVERRTVAHMADLVAKEFARVGLPTADLDRRVFEGPTLQMPDVAHPTGKTRMSNSRTDGVGKPSCPVHGVKGLYVAGSSVFPTCGHANPTQMILALALRLADHLATELHDPVKQLVGHL